MSTPSPSAPAVGEKRKSKPANSDKPKRKYVHKAKLAAAAGSGHPDGSRAASTSSSTTPGQAGSTATGSTTTASSTSQPMQQRPVATGGSQFLVRNTELESSVDDDGVVTFKKADVRRLLQTDAPELKLLESRDQVSVPDCLKACGAIFIKDIMQKSQAIRKEWGHSGPVLSVHIREAVRRLARAGQVFPFNHRGFTSLATTSSTISSIGSSGGS